MRGVLLLIPLIVAASLVCDPGTIPLKIRKQSEYAAEDESFEIMLGSQVLYTSPPFVNYEYRELDICITDSSTRQYWVQLRDSEGTSWTSGSYLEILGPYNNTVFKNAMVAKTLEHFPLSLYTPIEMGSALKTASSSVPSNWKDILYDDSDWEVLIPTEQSYGTQYYRKHFSGLSGLAAYELRVKYQYGVVFYINGNEIYRDNMPEGEVSSVTNATASYDSLLFRGVIRSASEVSSVTNVLAIELHFPEDVLEDVLNMDVWMAMYASSFASSSVVCYAVSLLPSDLEISQGQNGNYALDYNKGSYWSVTTLESPASLTFSYNEVGIACNGIEVFPSVNPSKSPSVYTLEGCQGSASSCESESTWSSIFYGENVEYGYEVSHVASTPFAQTAFKAIRFTAHETPANQLWAYEVHPLVCASVVPTIMTLSSVEVTAVAMVDEVHIAPTINGFSGCTVNPELPAGLSLLPNSCQIVGVATTPQSRKEYTLHSSSGSGYSTIFAITILACSGNVVEIKRTYKTSPQNEAFSIVDDITGFAEYTEALDTVQVVGMDVSRRLCLPSDRYRVMLFSSAAYWAKESFIYIYAITGEVKETLLRARLDDRMGAESVITFNVRFSIPSGSTWYYLMGSVPSNWVGGTIEGWNSASGEFPDSSNQIQLYKMSFNVDSLDNVGGISINLRYQYGCVLYLNSHEAFRNGVTGDISVTSMSSRAYESVKYRAFTLPIRSLSSSMTTYIHTGSNVIAVGIVAQNAEQRTSVFDCTLRLIYTRSSARVFDYTASGEGFSGSADNVFLDYYGSTIYKSTCVDNYVEIQFNDDRRETITSVNINTYYLNMQYLPRQVTILAKNDGDWDVLSVQQGWEWWIAPQSKKIYLSTEIPYNTYRFLNFSTGDPDNCYWRVNRIGLYLDKTDREVESLSYPETSIYRHIEMAELYPSSDMYKEFSCSGLPNGLKIDSASGVIMGTSEVGLSQQEVKIQARTLWNVAVETTLLLEVIVCYGGRSLITVNIRTDTAPTQISTRLYSGRSGSGTALHSMDDFPSNTMVYQDFCLDHALYTFVAIDSALNGWYFPAGYHLTVDIGTLPFDFSHVPAGDVSPIMVSTTFSSYLPFQIEYDEWKVWRQSESVPSNWALSDLNETAWETLKSEDIKQVTPITFYVRRKLSIPDLNDYHVLNVHVRYSGGLIAYFNGRIVARLNLPETTHPDTYALAYHDPSTYSNFHVILLMVGAAVDNNVIAFEIHRSEGMASDEVAFDATGVFGVTDCSPVLDSFIDIEATDVSSDLSGLFDFDPSSFVTLSRNEGATVHWRVENLEGSTFNSWGLVVGTTISSISWSLSARSDVFVDNTSLASQIEYTLVDRTKDVISAPAGIASFTEFTWTLIASLSSSPKVSAFLFQYCVETGDVCEGVGDYPPVQEGQISPSRCPEMYVGYTYRKCINGTLSDIFTDRCIPKLPVMLHYQQSFYSLARGLASEIPAPTVVNIVESYFMDDPSELPLGLQLDSNTGAISGTATNLTSTKNITIYARNSRGATSVTIAIEVREPYCEADGEFPMILAGEEYVFDCTTIKNRVGKVYRRCLFGTSDGVWEDTRGVCWSVPLIIALSVVAGILVIIIVGIIITMCVKRQRKIAASRPPKKKVVSILLYVCCKYLNVVLRAMCDPTLLYLSFTP